MLIRYLKYHNGNKAGETADVSPSLGSKLCWRGIAAKVLPESAPAPETAAIEPETERAVKPAAHARPAKSKSGIFGKIIGQSEEIEE